ncbi:DUF2460 domain-containing protein [Maricaulis parjimensis]|uniref:DUF2460 domain-containing protein n=1 Tax=Maricaulis parjimensis TaxID=144023 RepID=UPI0019393CFB|nr:DUF2460 domain-containing protein [Maricaulis parjimensis]
MNAFHEIRFPFALALGASGGPQRRTEITTLVSGREARNTPHADSRRRWDAGPGLKSLDDVDTLLAFFEARRGALHGFRFRDPLDNRSCKPSQAPQSTDQVLGTGDGVATQFQLVKHYESGGERWTRTIHKPVDGSVVVAVDGVEAAFSIDLTTGLVTLDAVPSAGAVVTAGFAFDCPVRFETDRLDIALDAIGAGRAHVPLIELIL